MGAWVCGHMQVSMAARRGTKWDMGCNGQLKQCGLMQLAHVARQLSTGSTEEKGKGKRS